MFKKNLSADRQDSKGFTLIELLVVIAIIGILSSVVLASLNSARTKGRDAKRVAEIQQMQLALELSFDANRQYPLLFNVASIVTPGYMSAIPLDPVTSLPYSYSALQSGGTCTSYHLRATLEDSTNPALVGDADAVAGTICVGSNADAAGTDPIYDVKP